MKPCPISLHPQHGAVLVVALIMLGVMTLFVVSMLKISIIELKIGGASQVVALKFSNADMAINNFIAANQGRFAPGFIVRTEVNNSPLTVEQGTVQTSVTQIGCGAWAPPGVQYNSGLQVAQFDIRAQARGTLGASATVLHQGVQSAGLAVPGSC